MKFTTAAIASSVAALAAAVPAQTCDTPPTTSTEGFTKPFTVYASLTGSDFDGYHFQAASRSLLIDAKNQNETCTSGSTSYAVFTLGDDTILRLYTDKIAQVFYTDVSGMGQGVIQYTTGDEPMGKYFRREGFVIENNELLYSLGGNSPAVGFQACGPALNANYSVWLDNFQNLAGFTNCKKFTARVVYDEDAPKCTYTSK